MTSICWKSAVTWSLLGLMFLLFVLMWGPAPALAGKLRDADAVLYEVTEDMYLSVRDAKGNVVSYVSDVTKATHRQAVAQLSGYAKVGTPLCPAWVKTITKAKRVHGQREGRRQPQPGDGQGYPERLLRRGGPG